ncbi:hypothetical protein GCM10027613_14050 [Microlunatus endophyticus]
MSYATDFDTISAERLRDIGSMKWTLFPETIGAFVAEMDFGAAPAITAALHALVDDGLFGYLPKKLSEALSVAAAEWEAKSYGWQVDPSRVHPIPDVIKGLEIAIEHYSRPESPVIVPVPAYMPFLKVPTSLGRKIIQLPLAEDQEVQLRSGRARPCLRRGRPSAGAVQPVQPGRPGLRHR